MIDAPPFGPLVLAELRADPRSHDLANREVRGGVLAALLGELLHSDHALARAVLAAEVAALENPAGPTEDAAVSVGRAGFVLALFRDPHDVWCQWAALRASADLELAAIAAAGLELTLAWVHASGDPRTHEVLAALEILDAEAVAAWWARMRAEHGGPEAPA